MAALVMTLSVAAEVPSTGRSGGGSGREPAASSGASGRDVRARSRRSLAAATDPPPASPGGSRWCLPCRVSGAAAVVAGTPVRRSGARDDAGVIEAEEERGAAVEGGRLAAREGAMAGARAPEEEAAAASGGGVVGRDTPRARWWCRRCSLSTRSAAAVGVVVAVVVPERTGGAGGAGGADGAGRVDTNAGVAAAGEGAAGGCE